MGRLKLLLFIVLAALFGGHAVAGTSSNSCSASSWMGSTCSISCGSGYQAVCTGGVFSASCKCVRNNMATAIRQIPSLTPTQVADAATIEIYIRTFATPGMIAVADDVAAVRAAVQSGDAVNYTHAEETLWQAFTALPAGDQTAIQRWCIQHGYRN